MAEIIVPRRREDWFDDQGNITLRAVKFFEGLTVQTNDSTTNIEIIEQTVNLLVSENSNFTAILQQTIKRLNGLSELTIDTSGFTADLTFITTDKVIA